jgi:hypothetical protein
MFPGLAVIGQDATKSIKELQTWVKENPTTGYTLVPFVRDVSEAWSQYDVALSHYVASAEQPGFWAVMRESSFGAIFASALRNSVSSVTEGMAIAAWLKSVDFESLPLSVRIRALAKWGISRLVIRTVGLSFYEPLIHGDNPIGKISYSDKFVTVVELNQQPILERNFRSAIVYVAPAIEGLTSHTSFDLAWLSEQLALHPNQPPEIICVRNCNDLEKLQKGHAEKIVAVCSKKFSCCDFVLNSFEDFYSRSEFLNTNLRGTSFNRAPEDSTVYFAAPYSEVIFDD